MNVLYVFRLLGFVLCFSASARFVCISAEQQLLRLFHSPPRLSGDIKAITLSRVQLFSVMEGWE